MYLLKNISFDSMSKNVLIENGFWIKINPSDNSVYKSYVFWGETEVFLGRYADISKFVKDDERESYLLTYANGYEVVPQIDNFKKIMFSVSCYEENNIDGYIIFLRHGDDIKTSGEKLYQRYNNNSEIVVVLKEKDFLEFNGRKIEVINNKLVLYI